MKRRHLALGLLLLLGYAVLFWHSDHRRLHVDPLPPPADAPPLGTLLDLSGYLPPRPSRPALLYFFAPDCQHARGATRRLKRAFAAADAADVDLYVVLLTDSAEVPRVRVAFERRYRLPARFLADADGALARRCGVAASPQVVLLDGRGRLRYRGQFSQVHTWHALLVPAGQATVPVQTGGCQLFPRPLTLSWSGEQARPE